MKRSLCNWMSAVGVTFCVLSGIVSDAKAGLIANGSFETSTPSTVNPDTDPNNFVVLTSGTEVDSWTATPGFNFYAATPGAGFGAIVGNAEDGTRYINLTNIFSIAQSISVNNGFTYELTYWERSRNLSGVSATTANLSATVSLAAGTATSTTLGVTGSGTASLSQVANSVGPTWSLYTFQFKSHADTTATLTFLNTGHAVGTFLDMVDVNLVATPEPSGLLLFAFGSAFFARINRRRRS